MPKNSELYYTNAKRWHREIYDVLSLRLRWSVLLNVTFSCLLIISMTTLLLLLPLKQTTPFVFSHNQTTGELTQLGELNKTDFTQDWTLTRYFLMSYINYRESYHSDDIERPYQLAHALSDRSVALSYEHEVDSQNIKSPYQRYGQHFFIKVHVKSIAKLNDHAAEIHFDKIIHEKASGKETIQSMVAIVKWHYTIEAITQKMLDRNPLNFKVTYYQVTPVTIEQTSRSPS